MAAAQLTPGAVAAMSEHAEGEGSLKPVLQVVDVRRVSNNANAAERFRMLLSDGVHTLQSMLATAENYKVRDRAIVKGTIVHLQEFTCSTIQFRRLDHFSKTEGSSANWLIHRCKATIRKGGLYQTSAVAAMCLQEQAASRPLIGDVVTALSYLASHPYDPNASTTKDSRTCPSTPRAKTHRRTTSVPDAQHAANLLILNFQDMRKDTSRLGEFEQDHTEGDGSGNSSGRNDGLDVSELLGIGNGKDYREAGSINKPAAKVDAWEN